MGWSAEGRTVDGFSKSFRDLSRLFLQAFSGKNREWEPRPGTSYASSQGRRSEHPSADHKFSLPLCHLLTNNGEETVDFVFFANPKLLLSMTRAYSRRSSPFGRALRFTRTTLQLQRIEFLAAANEQYVGTLERGVKSPTLNMVEKLSEVMQVHPLTLLALTYGVHANEGELEDLLVKVHSQILALQDLSLQSDA
jgi:transcriptional regulator with XRE-family HTH domain